MNAEVLFDGAVDGTTPYTDDLPQSRQTIIGLVPSPSKNDDFQIESVDELGRPSFRSIPRESLLTGRGSNLGNNKWKRKSELSNSAVLIGKERISIRAFNPLSDTLADPFSSSSEVVPGEFTVQP